MVTLICTAAGAVSLGVLEPSVDLSSAALNSARNLKAADSGSGWQSSLQRTATPGVGADPAENRAPEAMPASTTVSGLPVPALQAYRAAANTIAAKYRSCHLPWTVLAGIGLAESDHGRVGGAVMMSDGRSVPRVLGPVLNGRVSTAAITDTDDGRLDDDVIWDRAVGPMQFIPQTWATVAADGDGDGVRDPDDIDDAALAAAKYLCRYGLDLADEASLIAAIRSYNDSRPYVLAVQSYAEAYRLGEYPVMVAEPRAQQPDRSDRSRTPKADGRQSAGSPAARQREGTSGGGSDPAPNRPKPPPPPKQPKPEPQPSPQPTPVPPKPVPVTKTLVATGVLSWCGDGWCVEETYVGMLGGLLNATDYDGDCAEESVWQELNGLATSATPVEVTLRQTLVDGEVTVSEVTGFVIPDPPVCETSP